LTTPFHELQALQAKAQRSPILAAAKLLVLVAVVGFVGAKLDALAKAA
jgi:hypothetical protein